MGCYGLLKVMMFVFNGIIFVSFTVDFNHVYVTRMNSVGRKKYIYEYILNLLTGLVTDLKVMMDKYKYICNVERWFSTWGPQPLWRPSSDCHL